MSAQGFVEGIAAAAADSTALTNTTTATSILTGTAKPVIPAQTIGKAGKVYRGRLFGRISTLVTSPGTLTLDVRLGSTIVFNGGAMTLNTTAQTNATFEFEFLLKVSSVGSGATATILGAGKFTSRAVIGSAAVGAGGAGILLLPDTAPAVGTGFDSTIAQTLDVFGTWSVASASNSIISHIALIEDTN